MAMFNLGRLRVTKVPGGASVVMEERTSAIVCKIGSPSLTPAMNERIADAVCDFLNNDKET